MIEAQLELVRKYPESNLRRQAIESELVKDLEYVKGNMEINPKVINRRENMRSMHKDFFALLKWQREKMLRVPFDEPHKLTGNIEELKNELLGKSKESIGDSVGHMLVPEDNTHFDSNQAINALADMTIQEKASASGCPVTHKIPADATIEDCPVYSGGLESQKNTDNFTIHRLY